MKKGNEGKYQAQKRTILKVERKQALNRLSQGILIGALGVGVIYFLLVWLMK